MPKEIEYLTDEQKTPSVTVPLFYFEKLVSFYHAYKDVVRGLPQAQPPEGRPPTPEKTQPRRAVDEDIDVETEGPLSAILLDDPVGDNLSLGGVALAQRKHKLAVLAAQMKAKKPSKEMTSDRPSNPSDE